MRIKLATCLTQHTCCRSATNKWYVTFAVECDPVLLEENEVPVGIDVGLKTFATLSTGQEIENPRFFRLEENALAKAQRKLCKQNKGSWQRRKQRRVVARVHERTRWRRSNFTHQHSRQIVNHFGIICVEDLHVKRMLHNHCLAKSISDAAWSQFFAQLSSKAAEAGREFLKVNPAHTTQDCSRCRYRQPMPLSERTYQCPRCFLVLDRDLNASYNIVGLGLQSRIVPEAPALEPGE